MIKMDFLDWLSVYEHEKKMMKAVMVQKKSRPKNLIKKPRHRNATQKELEINSRSNILEKIVYCLFNGLYQHMLYWHDLAKKEFIVKFVHMNSPEWNEDDLGLFIELDGLSLSKSYFREEGYASNCKIRCRSNLQKLCGGKNGALTFLGKTKKGKSVTLRKYRLNVNGLLNENINTVERSNAKDGTEPSLKASIPAVTKLLTARVKKEAATEAHPQKGQVDQSDSQGSIIFLNDSEIARTNGFRGCKTVQGITYIKGKLKAEYLSNKQSHCLCLSKTNSICFNLPIGATCIVNPILDRPNVLDISFTTENRSDDTRNMVQLDPLKAYEHEKQMDGNGGALPTTYIDGSNIDSRNTDSESRREFVLPNNDDPVERMNGIESPKIDSRNTNSESGREFVVPNYDGPVERMNGIESPKIDSRNTDYDALIKEMDEDPLPAWCEDFRPDIGKYLQADNDPLLSSASAVCSSAILSGDNYYFQSNIEESFPLENIFSSSAD